MIGHILCVLGRHNGQEQGGTIAFTCLRCGQMRWQSHRHRKHLRVVEAEADRRLEAGDHAAADWAHEEVARITGGR